MQVVAELTQDFALCSATDEATAIRHDVSLFQALQAVLNKKSGESRKPTEQIDAAICQLVSKAITTEGEIIDVITAGCLTAVQSEDHLIDLLKAAQLAPYVRGKMHGVMDTKTGRKYRLSTLGLDREGQETVERLMASQPRQDRIQARMQKIEDIKLVKIQRQWLRLGFCEEIAETLQGDQRGGKRGEDIAHNKHVQRQRRLPSS